MITYKKNLVEKLMKKNITLELYFMQKHSSFSNTNPARFELELLNNGCYTLASFFDHNHLHHVLIDWLKLHNSAEDLEASRNDFNEFLLKTQTLEEIKKDDQAFNFQVPEENVSEIVAQSVDIECNILDESSSVNT